MKEAIQDFPSGAVDKNPPASAGDMGSVSGQGRFHMLQGRAIPSTILAWKIPWTEEPEGLQSIGLQRVGHK